MIKLTFNIFLSFLGISVCLLMYSSCGPKKITPQSQLHDSVMEIHDEVMPKMRDIHRLKKGLKNKTKEGLSETQASQVSILRESLERADDAMMDWMAGYNKPSEGDTEAMEYLKREKEKIKIVREDMISAITNAQNFINAQ
ncbi:MAG: hypothetical protein ACI9FN_003771 [Saprospiraceae bacterium]|jgi:hypothetical protein